MEMSRLDAGEAQMERVRFDIANLASTTCEQMRLLAEDRSINLRCDAPAQVEVVGDRSRIKQVIVNLLDNAIKYTPRGGEVGLSARTANRKALIEVSDNGVGIPAEALPHVFERFYRVDKTRFRSLGGSGLGLAIVKSICTAHGGRVDAFSSENQGSCFRVVIPLPPNVDRAVEARDPEHPAKGFREESFEGER